MGIETYVEGDLARSEDGELGLDVRRIDLSRRISNAMRAARDMDDFCKRAKAKTWRVV